MTGLTNLKKADFESAKSPTVGFNSTFFNTSLQYKLRASQRNCNFCLRLKNPRSLSPSNLSYKWGQKPHLYDRFDHLRPLRRLKGALKASLRPYPGESGPVGALRRRRCPERREQRPKVAFKGDFGLKFKNFRSKSPCRAILTLFKSLKFQIFKF